MVRSDPQAGVNQWKKFLETVQEEPIKPFAAKERFGIDIWQAGIRLGEAVVGKAGDTFNEDDPAESEKWLAEADAIVQALDQFQPEGESKPETLMKDIGALRLRMDAARARVAKLARLKNILGEGSDEEVARARREAQGIGMDNDPSFKAMLDDVESKIQSKAVYNREPQPIPPTAVPDDGLTSLLFAPRFDKGERRPDLRRRRRLLLSGPRRPLCAG